MKQNTIDWRIVATGLVCIAVIECYALFLGFNGILLKGVLITIALAIGISIKSPLSIR